MVVYLKSILSRLVIFHSLYQTEPFNDLLRSQIIRFDALSPRRKTRNSSELHLAVLTGYEPAIIYLHRDRVALYPFALQDIIKRKITFPLDIPLL